MGMERMEELEDECDVGFKAPQDVIDFVRTAPGMHIASEDVETVKANEFEDLKKQYDELEKKFNLDRQALLKEEALARQAEEAEKRLLAIQQEAQRQQAGLHAGMTAELERLKQQVKQAEENADRATKDAAEAKKKR